MTDRDHFAAAALTGLINTHAVYHKEPPSLAVMAFAAADAMLREREKREPVAFRDGVPVYSTNHDAAPAATAVISDSHECPPNVRCQQTGESRFAASGSCSGTGKQPAPPRVETDGFSLGSRTGQINRTPEREPPRRECGESSLRDVPQQDNCRAAGGPEHHISEAEIEGLRAASQSYEKSDEKRVDSPTFRDTTPPRNGTPAECSVQGEGSVPRSGTENEPVAWATFYPNGSTASVYVGRQPPHAEPLYRHPQPTLTDAEREAIEWAVRAMRPECRAVLQSLLERFGDAR